MGRAGYIDGACRIYISDAQHLYILHVGYIGATCPSKGSV